MAVPELHPSTCAGRSERRPLGDESPAVVMVEQRPKRSATEHPLLTVCPPRWRRGTKSEDRAPPLGRACRCEPEAAGTPGNSERRVRRGKARDAAPIVSPGMQGNRRRVRAQPSVARLGRRRMGGDECWELAELRRRNRAPPRWRCRSSDGPGRTRPVSAPARRPRPRRDADAEDHVRPTQRPDLTLELGDPLPVIGRRARLLAGVDARAVAPCAARSVRG